ncbi:MAG: PQQ-binding-like beta-propeller repeat protein [Candidatus Dadabacteria bacterium]
MKQFAFLVLLFISLSSHSQIQPFRFAFLTDTHIGSADGVAEEDLRRSIADINSMNDISFVVLTGDITELGSDEQFSLAKKLLMDLKAPYYIIPGNHDTGWSESGGLGFTKAFGSDKFQFDYNGIHFLGCASGPYVRMSDGHVPRDAMNWMHQQLNKINNTDPIIYLNHYPLDNALDNWYEVIDLLKQKNTLLAICGHGHNNRMVQAEDIPSVMGRSNLRAKQPEGGYNIINVRQDSITFTERKPVSKTEKLWTAIPVVQHKYSSTGNYPRPDFSMNKQYSNVKAKWTYSSSANVISTPAVMNNLVVFGNQTGLIEAVKIDNGKRVWKFQADGPIFSSPAVAANKVVVASADGYIYALNNKGKEQWKFKCEKSVLGSPLIDKGLVYIGGSDHRFSAYNLSNGSRVWSFSSLEGPVVSKPVIAGNKIIFGAWDKSLYCLDKNTGSLLWKWSNGSPVINYSPAACIPVIKDDVVYIAAPDRYLSAIDINTGKTLWRTNQSTVRESIGISEDGDLIYGKTMQDSLVAFRTNPVQATVAWKLNVGYGYEHSPSMIIEKNGKAFFGTRNGIVYSIDPKAVKVNWSYKVDNSMVNTVNVLSDKEVIASTMDGKVVLLKAD